MLLKEVGFEELTDYIEVFPRLGSSSILIAFSGADTPRGRFHYFNLLKNYDENVILVNSTKEDYYQFGLDGVGGLPDSINLLRKIIRKLAGENAVIRTFGCSMGGYGALLYGSLLKAKEIYAFGPTGPLYSASIYGGPFHKKNIEKYQEVKNYIFDSKCIKYLIFGDEIIHDHAAAVEFLGLQNAELIMFEGAKHAVIQPLLENFSVKNLFDFELIKSFSPIYDNKVFLEGDFIVDFLRFVTNKVSRDDFLIFYNKNKDFIFKYNSYKYWAAFGFFRAGDVGRACSLLGESITLDRMVSLKSLDLFCSLKEHFSASYIDRVRSVCLEVVDADGRLTRVDKDKIKKIARELG